MRMVDVRSVRTRFDGYFKVYEAELTYQLPNGQMSEPVRRLSLERGDSAAAVVVDEGAGTALLARQFRYPAVARGGPGWLLELVAGAVDGDETPQACVRREIEEELGYETLSLHPISTFYTSPGGSSERVHLFHATVSSESRVGPGGGNPAEQEDIELVEIPLAQVPELLESGQVVDAKTLIGLGWLVQNTINGGG
jgi:ADP-ribose pyrophosphatase